MVNCWQRHRLQLKSGTQNKPLGREEGECHGCTITTGSNGERSSEENDEVSL